MNVEPPTLPRDGDAEVAWTAVSAAFTALGRVLLCLDAQFRVLHASPSLDRLLGSGTATEAVGEPVHEIVGPDLLGPEGALRNAMLAGERREGWRAIVGQDPGDGRLVSVTAAPLSGSDLGVCDPRVSYIVVLRPAEEDPIVLHSGAVTLGELVSRSASMSKILQLVESLKTSDATVILTGESGTGKEVVARAIHRHSPRRDGPFVAVNCAALPGELLESEMFGHIRGAFTGAVRDHVGRFERAAGGTLFLDEVGDLPVPLQVKLLRVLQQRTFERVGDGETRTTDARIIAATNRNLALGIREGWFREDLFYRLRVVPIEIPPLRDRREDIEPLAQRLLARVGARQGRALRFSPAALRSLLHYGWPGNVRELENALEYAVAVCRRQTVLPEDLPSEVAAASTHVPGNGHGEAPHRDRGEFREAGSRAMPFAGQTGSSIYADDEPNSNRSPIAGEQAQPAERAELLRALESNRWRRSATAKSLGISRTTLWRRMREAGLANDL